jgi:hypothetical protein
VISACNYAASAVRFMEDVVSGRRIGVSLPPLDLHHIAGIAQRIKSSVHFAVEDGGIIFADGLKGIRGVELRLPFPSITIEYLNGDPLSFDHKVLILASEAESLIRSPDVMEPVIQVLFVLFSEKHGVWLPQPVGFNIPALWYEGTSDTSIEGMIVAFIKAVPTQYDKIIEESGFDTIKRAFFNGLFHHITALMEFLEALSCSNVSTEIIQHESKRLNEKRVRKGKLPLYETRVLSIPVPNIRAPRGECGHSDRRGPRQHLRRGHIRILPDERRIWVNSCVVGSRADGVIHKRYTVDKQ